MKEHINGPVNYVKLDGEINGIKKIFYVFMDKHFDLEKQTRCNNFDSKDISNYLYRKIKKTKTPINFFMEIRNEQIAEPVSNKRGRYMEDVISLFKSEFIKKNNKVSFAKSNKNVRLHYLDIRDFFNLSVIMQEIKSEVDNTLSQIKINKPNVNLIKILDKKLLMITNYLIKIKTEIDNTIQEKKLNKDDKMGYYLDKIINKYNNKELQQNLIDNIMENKDYYLSKLFDMIKSLNAKLNAIKNNQNEINQEAIIMDIKSLFSKLFFNIVLLNSKITDVYLLRRILDKDYVTNGIIYSGFSHSLNYIDFLVKKYNFKVTYVYYLNEKIKKNDLITLNEIIKKSSMNELNDLLTTNDQCVDIDEKEQTKDILIN